MALERIFLIPRTAYVFFVTWSSNFGEGRGDK